MPPTEAQAGQRAKAVRESSRPAERLWLTPPAEPVEGAAVPLPQTLSGSTDAASLEQWLGRWTGPDTTEFWITETSRLIAKYQLNAPRASRVLAYVAVAMNDASVLASRRNLSRAGRLVAVHVAASGCIAHFFPNESAGRAESLGASAVSAVGYAFPQQRQDIEVATALGHAILSRIKDRTLTDGADEVWDARDRPSFPGAWKSTPPMDAAHPQEPLAGQWRRWSAYEPEKSDAGKPPAPTSERWLASAKEVLAVSRKLTSQQRQLAQYWHLDQGTVTPPGQWNLRALEPLRRGFPDEPARLALLALMNVAIMDATIECWRVKYTYWIQRPVTLIRARFDTAFTPMLVTPMHPSYPSGHACVSGAAAEVMKRYLPADAKVVEGWARDAAQSRLYGGIHYRIDNDDGLKLGRRVAMQLLAGASQAPR